MEINRVQGRDLEFRLRMSIVQLLRMSRVQVRNLYGSGWKDFYST